MVGKLALQNANPKRPCFQASMRADGTLEILIYEEIGENWWDGGGITAKAIRWEIDNAGDYANILMRINSPGGDAFEGIAIYNVIRAQGKPVEVCVDGIAASAASIIAMCGDTITMGPNTMMMIHNAWSFCVGEAADMRKMADALEKISGAIAQTYVTRTKKPVEEIISLMDAETWMTAQECLDRGFATQITAEPDQQIQENALAMARKFRALGRMKQVPEGLKPEAGGQHPEISPNAAVECGCDCANCQELDCGDCTNPNCVDENCVGCPMQEGSDDSSNLSLYEARLAVLKMRRAA